MHQNRFQLGLRPRPRWGSSQRSPDSQVGLKGSTSKGRGGDMGRGMGGKGGGTEGRGGEGDGGEGTGREGTPNILLHPQFQFSRNMPAQTP